MLRFLGGQWVTILLLVWIGGYTLAALEYGIGIRPHPQSGFVPFLLGSIIFGLSAFVLIRAFLDKRIPVAEERETVPKRKFFWFALLLLTATASFEHLGFFLTSMALIFLTSCFMGLRGWRRILLLSFLATLGAEVIFAGLLGVPLPGVLTSGLFGGF